MAEFERVVVYLPREDGIEEVVLQDWPDVEDPTGEGSMSSGEFDPNYPAGSISGIGDVSVNQ